MSETNTLGIQNGIEQVFESMPGFAEQPQRRAAIQAFQKLGLPTTKSEEYRFTPITRHLEKNFKATDFTSAVSDSFSSIEEYLIAGFQSNVIVFTNGRYNEKLSVIISPASQLSLKTLDAKASFDTNHPALTSDAFAAMTNAFWQAGISIEVPENTKVELPVMILHLVDAGSANVTTHTRMSVNIGKGSEVTIIEKYNSIGAHPIFRSSVESIEVQESAVLNYYKIQNESGLVYQAGTMQIRQLAKSRVNTFTLTLDGQLIRNTLQILVDGEGCESHFNGLYILQKNTLADNHTVVDHLRPNSYSNELYKGIMDGHSKGVFNGKIYVRPHAQKTNAFQSNRNILLSDTATVNTKPQLEIWADDVKCSHGCTSGQLDEEALFYLRSRGISRHIARAMVLYAFAGEVLAPVKDVVLKAYLDNLISERLQKNL